MSSRTRAKHSHSIWSGSSPIATAERRHVLAILADSAGPLPTSVLALRLAASTGDVPCEAVPDDERRRHELSLLHSIVPVLTAQNVVEQGPQGLEFTGSWEPDFGTLELSVPDVSDPDHPAWDVLVAVLDEPIRVQILERFADDRAPCSLIPLALDVTAESEPVTDDEFDSLLTRLHHVDVPKLADIGVLDYDPDTRTVAPGPAFETVVEPVSAPGSE